MAGGNPERRAFVRSEHARLARFIDVDALVGWRRTYRCDCGFQCFAPGDIWDHTQVCAAVAKESA